MIKVGINGACGRMGRRLVALVHEADDLSLAAALESARHPAMGSDVGTATGGRAVGVPLVAEMPAGLEVLIDFSSPESTARRARECAARGTALVTGTTGLDDTQRAAVEAAAREIPCLASPNMSLGVNVLFRLVRQAAEALGRDYDAEIIEAHHRFKQDAPSGTALRLAEAVAEATGRDLDACLVHGRSGRTGERPQRQIGVHAVRGGDIVGDHTVSFIGLGERIEMTHRAQSRDTFCRGALAAARFLAGKPPGMYRMSDVLGL